MSYWKAPWPCTGGEFLAGFGLDDSSPFEEWLLFTREQLTRQAALTMRRLSDLFEMQGYAEQAQDYAHRQLQLEPWNEEVHRRLMHLLALSGDRSAALAQYEACRRFLKTEWGVAPAPETSILAAEIRQGRVQAFDSPTPANDEIKKLPECVGRETELVKLQSALEAVQSRQGQVIFITGEAGQRQNHFAARVCPPSYGPQPRRGGSQRPVQRLQRAGRALFTVSGNGTNAQRGY